MRQEPERSAREEPSSRFGLSLGGAGAAGQAPAPCQEEERKAAVLPRAGIGPPGVEEEEYRVITSEVVLRVGEVMSERPFRGRASQLARPAQPQPARAISLCTKAFAATLVEASARRRPPSS